MNKLVMLLGAMVVGSALAGIDVRLTGADGKPVEEKSFRVELDRSTADDGMETVRCKVTSAVEGSHLLRIVGRVALAGDGTVAYDGHDERKLAKGTVRKEFFKDDTFMMGAVWGGASGGTAFALGADDCDSFADFTATPNEMEISIHAAFVRKGAVYVAVFHSFPFEPKYGIRDAFARYYQLYPKRFRRDPRVDPAIFGIAAQYASWWVSDPETCRLMNATWEWCICAGRSWGDFNNTERPVGPMNTDYTWEEGMRFTDRYGRRHNIPNASVDNDEYDRILNDRLRGGYFCGVANAFYVMAVSCISDIIAKRYPDSIATGEPVTHGYPTSTQVFPFVECSWGRQIRKDFARLAKEREISAVAFDVCWPSGVYRGERLSDMTNVGWDEYGAGKVRGYGSGELFDHLRTLDLAKSPYRLASVANSNRRHISDKLYADMTMAETAPWDEPAPFPLHRRFVAGERGVTMWEGYRPTQLAPDFKQWPVAARNEMLHSLACCSVHRSFFAGASLPARGFMAEWAALASHAFVRMNDACWKPVPGARVLDTDAEVARYGLGTGAYLAVNNLMREPRRIGLEVFPGEIASGRAGTVREGGYLFVPFYGGVSTNAFAAASQRVDCAAGSLLAGVLEAVGEVRGTGTLVAHWAGTVGAPTLRIESVDFTGEIVLKDAVDSYRLAGGKYRKLVPGGRAGAKYCDAWMDGALAAIRAADKPEAQTIVRSSDDDAREQAARIARFFRAATGKAKIEPEVVVDASLAPRTVRALDFGIAGETPRELMVRTKRFLDALHWVRYPKYRPQVPVPAADRKLYRLFRP